MEQHRAIARVRRAHVELQHLAVGGGLQPDRALLGGEVAGQRHLRSVVGDLADRVAHHQFAFDQRQTGGTGHHRVGGVQHLGQARARTFAQRRQRPRRTRGGDEVIGRRRETASTQEAGSLHEPRG